MSGFILLRPWWLLGLPLIAAMAIYNWRRVPDTGGWEKVIAPNIFAQLRKNGMLKTQEHDQKYWMILIAMLFISLGLTGPAFERDDAPIFAQTDAIVIAMDVSPSITQSKALEDAQSAAAQILDGAQGRPVGLILYAGDAYLVAAPTSDPRILETLIAVIDDTTMPEKGTSVASALAVAAPILDDLKRADLILISDGDGVDEAAMQEAENLRSKGVRISAVFLDRNSTDAPLPNQKGLVDLTQSHVTTLTNLDPFLAKLPSAHGARLEAGLAALQFQDFGIWIAALALFPMLFLFRRSH